MERQALIERIAAHLRQPRRFKRRDMYAPISAESKRVQAWRKRAGGRALQ